ncbi:MAG: hypothetical protein K1X47_13300, partial [Cyclobacteriaceae bacterium]|nr:hypothetical protein [Cyclobacteriaceae bacterium]
MNNSLTGQYGQIRVNVKDNNTVVDGAGNFLGGPGASDGDFNTSITANQYYTIIFAEPTSPPITFTADNATPTGFTLHWKPASSPTVQANYYLIQLKKATVGSHPALTDGTLAPNNSFSDGTLSFYWQSDGSAAYAVDIVNDIGYTLTSGTNYDIRIVGLNYSGIVSGQYMLDYLTSATLDGTAATTTAASATLNLTTAAATISSLNNSQASAHAQATANVEFTITDELTDVDNVPTKFSNLVVKQGTGNAVADWTQILAGAELTDGTTVLTASSITATTIVFSGIASSTAGNLGYVADGSTPKSYKINVWLKSTLGGTLPGNVDNLPLSFKVDNSSFTLDNSSNSELSTQFAASQQAETGGSANKVAIIASKLVFTQQPQTSIGVQSAFPSGGQPKLEAYDANNNLDADYNVSANITNSKSLGQSIASKNFTAGKLDLNDLIFTTQGINTTITVAGTGTPVVTSATSSAQVTAVISNKTTITAGPATEPVSFSSLVTQPSGAISPQLDAGVNFDFVLTDDVGVDGTNFTDNDGLPTLVTNVVIAQGAGNDGVLSDWTKAIAGAELSDGTDTQLATVNSSTLVFPVSASSSMYTVADGTAKTYTLRIWLKNPVDPTLIDIIDNKDFVFSINQGNVTTGATNQTSLMTASNTDSGNGNNQVDVDATQIDFTTQPSASQSYDAAIITSPIARARDANSNLDIDYNTSASVLTATPATYPVANATVTVTNGIFTFDPSLNVTSGGGGGNGDLTNFVLSSGTLADGLSSNFSMNYSGTSDIVLATFTPPSNIQYATASNQVASITNANAIEVARFTVRDGGASLSDPDGTKTVLSTLTVNIQNWQYLRTVALFDGATNIAELPISNIDTNTGDLLFSGLSAFSVNDNSSKDLSVKVSFIDVNVDDNALINVKVVNATTAGVSSGFAAAGTATAFRTLTGDQNRIEVIATQIDFTTIDLSPSVFVPMSVTVEARDANANRDVDYNGTVSAFSTTPGAPAFVTSNNPTGAFVAGVKVFPTSATPSANFQFTTGLGLTALNLTSGPGSGGTSVHAGTISGTSPQVDVKTSFDSEIQSDAAYIPLADIPYINHQSATFSSITDGFELSRFVIYDGNPTKPYAGQADIDGASTILDTLDVELSSIAGKLPVKRLAIYVNGTLVAQKDAAALASGVSTTRFSGLGITVADEQSKSVSILATFQSTSADVLDNDAIALRIVHAGSINGSNFTTMPGTAWYTTAGASKIEVEATRLDFTTQAVSNSSPYISGINYPMQPPVIEARDANQILDLDYDSGNANAAYQSVNLTAAGTPTLSITSYPFTQGKILLPTITPPNALTGSLYYTTAGDGNGKLIATANGLSSETNGSTGSVAIEVIHVTAVIDNTKVISSNNLKSTNKDQIVFGFQLIPNNVTNPQNAETTLSQFTISFDKPYRQTGVTILKDFKVFELQNTSTADLQDVTLLGGKVEEISSTSGTDIDQVRVTFTTPRKLYDVSGPPFQAGTKSYFLAVNVDGSANLNTPKLTPLITSLGYGSTTADIIQLTAGSVTTFNGNVDSTLVGKSYSFANTKPPKLVSTIPASGKFNVNPSLNAIYLKFDVKTKSLDGQVKLYDRQNNKLKAILTSADGIGVLKDSLQFDIPVGTVLKPDSVYYVTIEQGAIPDTGSPTGIADDASNFFGGISYNGGLYFKISSPVAPKMIATKASSYFASSTAGVFNASFDQFGTAYYLVTTHGAAAPDTAMLKHPLTYSQPGSLIASGSFAIQQVAPNYQSTAFAAQLNPGSTYDVWLFAENDAQPLAVGTAAPYGSAANKHVVGSAGPTLQLSIPAVISSTLSTPLYQICPTSEVLLDAPIVIGETSSNDFTLTGRQDFNLLLPTGFQFNTSKLPTVKLAGTDFTSNSDSVYFINNTLLNISFINEGTTSIDNIIISDIVVESTVSAANGNIIRFAGSGITTVSNNRKLATLATNTATAYSFSNSYSNTNNFSSIGITNVVTAIPDNYVDTQLNAQAVKLIPDGTILASRDIGASLFSGTGVTNDVLSLNGVAKNAAFDITMSHQDMNGCITSKAEQYLVYDHTKAIPKLGQQACITNVNFLSGGDSPSIQSTDTLKFDALAGYKLFQLFANIPSKADTFDIKNPTANTANSQIIYGAEWEKLVNKVPVVVGTAGAYNSYAWDYSHILNAVTESGNKLTINPYNFFNDSTPAPNRRPYWKGGSLGLIEFTGRFNSTADGSVTVPFRQEVEVFVPPVPVIEVGAPTALRGNTPLFCENQTNDILINGFPFASAGASIGYFVLRDSASGTVIYNKLNVNLAVNDTIHGFTDNTNGTANLKPSVFNASLPKLKRYKTILVEYTYRDNNSPCSGTAQFYIRIVPNPVAQFVPNSLQTVHTPTATAYCENFGIEFDPATSTIAADGISSITQYSWNFDDPNAGGTNANTDVLMKPTHFYTQSKAYAPKLSVTSNFGCQSPEVSKPVNVGALPVVNFSQTGVSVQDSIAITNLSTVPSDAALNDGLAKLVMQFGDGTQDSVRTSSFNLPFKHPYALPGAEMLNLIVTSKLGCVESYAKQIVILKHVGLQNATAYGEEFKVNGGDWQHLADSTSANLADSWQYVSSSALGSGYWKT